MSNVYKIEALNEHYANMIHAFIDGLGGKCIVQGSAIITDYPFETNNALWLLPLISGTHDQLTESDFSCWTGAY
ncbi:hypothetical protein P7F88_01985 [Vibrio hannami]|uniref:hypothetical protein n=1 Tax=Vibrio hannami TaxID=2717094 RepID=UPI00240ED9F6|nr:hypothetical protein [Vibrio hannami]MDG3084924.1 hypothetical protein [Vibrio hannami]